MGESGSIVRDIVIVTLSVLSCAAVIAALHAGKRLTAAMTFLAGVGMISAMYFIMDAFFPVVVHSAVFGFSVFMFVLFRTRERSREEPVTKNSSIFFPLAVSVAVFFGLCALSLSFPWDAVCDPGRDGFSSIPVVSDSLVTVWIPALEVGSLIFVTALAGSFVIAGRGVK